MLRHASRCCVVVAALQLVSVPGSALTVTCGMTIPAGSGKVVLDGDVLCMDAHTAVVTVQGPGSTLDLHTHTLDGNGMTTYGVVLGGAGAEVEDGIVKGAQTVGVLLEGTDGRVSNVVVKDGGVAFEVTGQGNTIVGGSAVGQNVAGVRSSAANTVIKSTNTKCSGIGFHLQSGAAGSVLLGNTAARGQTAGFRFAASGIQASKNTAVANETGFEVAVGTGVTLKQNTAIGNGLGFSVQGAGVVLTKNVAKGNGGDGFTVSGSQNILSKNQARVNGGTGMRVIAGATDNILSGNTAYGNASVDLDDEESCSGATWTNNKLGTAGDACID